MARKRRIDIEGGIHHVMNRGVNRQAIFFADDDRIEFGRRLADIYQRFGVETLAYCLMGNHYHLLLRTPRGGLSEAMHRLGALYTRHTNDRVGRDGPMFRSRFHSILVTTDSYLLTATRYIHRNALDIAGVDSIGDYRWSSYPAYAGMRRSPSFLRTDLIAGMFDGDTTALADFHLGEQATVGHQERLRSVAELQELVGFVLAVDDLHNGGDGASPRGRDRTLLVLYLDRVEEVALGVELEHHLGFPSATARRSAQRRAKRRLAVDPVIAALCNTSSR